MTITKSISINCSAEKAFEFVANTANWLQFAILDISLTTPADDGYLEIPRDAGKVNIRPQMQYGILDYEFPVEGVGKLIVPARVVSTPDGCHLLMTFSKPENLPTQFFEEAMKLLEEEFATLKKILEG